MDIIYFFGRFHVLALHLPIGIILAALGLEWLTRKNNHQQLKLVAPYLWGLAALTAIVTVILGYMHISEGDFTSPAAVSHRFYGTTLAILTTVVWVLCRSWNNLYQRGRPLIAIVLLVLLTLTGHYGGNLTHGSTYLVEYAPTPLRALAGLNARRAPVETLSMADPYLDIIAPLLQTRCGNCHNDDKSRGQFTLSNYELTLAGGESGVAIVPGDTSIGELYRRITLPASHDDFMPADGKTPLTESQTELIAWWIEAGAPVNTSLGLISLTPTIENLLMIELGLGGAQQNSSLPSSAVADSELVESLFQAGFLVRQISQSDAALVVSVYSRNTEVSPEQIEVLLQAVEQVVNLDLQGSSLNDQSLNQFQTFTQLTWLGLSNNAITDAGVSLLAGLSTLEYLNLYGNSGVTDNSIEALAAMENLAELYLWQTSITDSGIERLRQLRPDLRIIAGTSNNLLP